MTVLELMIVLAIIAAASLLVRSGFRLITKADLVENSTELSAVLKRTSQLAVEKGELHRVVLDFEKASCHLKVKDAENRGIEQCFSVEICKGAITMQKAGRGAGATEIERGPGSGSDQVQRALEKGKERMKGVPGESLTSDPEAATSQALAIAGHHIGDRECVPVDDAVSGDAQGEGFVRGLRSSKGIKLKEVWVQHKDESTTKGQVEVYFFPTGSSEKAVIELTDGSETFSVLVYGLTGRVELMDGVLQDVNDHMLRNVMGDKDKAREAEQ
jgi:hypothetical protein